MVNSKLASLLVLACTAALAVSAVPATNPIGRDDSASDSDIDGDVNGNGDENVGGTTWFQTNSANADNSTVVLNEGGKGTIEALGGDFYANSGARWNSSAIEIGFVAGTNQTNTLGGGYTVTPDGISVGAGITYLGRSVSFSLKIDKDGNVAAELDGDNLACTGQDGSASCTGN